MVIKLVAESMGLPDVPVGDYYIDVAAGSDGRKYIFTYGNSGSMFTGGKVSTVAGGKWQDVIEFYWEDYEESFYNINNRDVSGQEYENILALYNSGGSSRIDGRAFSGWGVREFLEELRLGGAPQWSKIVEAVYAKKYELNEWFSIIYRDLWLGNFNANTYNKDKLIRFALMSNWQNGKWRDEADGTWGSVQSIDKVYIDETIDLLFGIKEITREPDVENIDEPIFNSIEYRNGRYYVSVMATEAYGSYVQTVKWIHNGNGTYSAQLDLYAASMGTYPENPYDSKEFWRVWDEINNKYVDWGHLQPSYTAAAVVRIATYNGEQVYQLLELINSGTIDDLTMTSAPEPTAPTEPTATPMLAPTAAPAVGYITIKDERYSTSLTELDLRNINLTDADIEPLRHMTNLTDLFLTGNQISDISPLAGLTNLTFLILLSNQISDIGPLAGLTNLTTLSLDSNQIIDIGPLAWLTNLETLHLGNNEISDISPLARLANLRLLHLGNNEISDIGPLARLANLEWLYLGPNQISDIGPLAGLANLFYLELNNNQISDISPLAKLTGLTILYLDNNNISDWFPVAHITNVYGRP
jgi:hypothetical protein